MFWGRAVASPPSLCKLQASLWAKCSFPFWNSKDANTWEIVTCPNDRWQSFGVSGTNFLVIRRIPYWQTLQYHPMLCLCLSTRDLSILNKNINTTCNHFKDFMKLLDIGGYWTTLSYTLIQRIPNMLNGWHVWWVCFQELCTDPYDIWPWIIML